MNKASQSLDAAPAGAWSVDSEQQTKGQHERHDSKLLRSPGPQVQGGAACANDAAAAQGTGEASRERAVGETRRNRESNRRVKQEKGTR